MHYAIIINFRTSDKSEESTPQEIPHPIDTKADDKLSNKQAK